MKKDTSYMQTPEYKKAMSIAMKKSYAQKPMTEERKANISRGNSGKIRSPEWCKNISEAKKGIPSPIKGKPQPSSSYKRSEETKKRMSEARKLVLQKHPELLENMSNKLKNRVFTDESKQLMSESRKRYFREHPEAREEISKRNLGTSKKSKTRSKTYIEKWQDPEFVQMMMQARNYKPNKQEIELDKILQELYPNQFRYNGDCRLGIVLNGYIPDFVNVNGKKQVIEFFGSYWHDQEGRGEEDRVSRYKAVGWHCLVIWDYELKDKDILKNKIKAFVGEC